MCVSQYGCNLQHWRWLMGLLNFSQNLIIFTVEGSVWSRISRLFSVGFHLVFSHFVCVLAVIVVVILGADWCRFADSGSRGLCVYMHIWLCWFATPHRLQFGGPTEHWDLFTCYCFRLFHTTVSLKYSQGPLFDVRIFAGKSVNYSNLLFSSPVQI